MLGTPIALPFILAPVGSSRMFYPRGEEVAARSPDAAGTHLLLSTLSGCRLEDVKKATTGPAWYQLYLCRRPRRRARRRSQRAQDAGYSALVVTIDTPVAGMRERDLRNGIEGAADAQVLADAAVRRRSSSRGRAGSPASSATAA